MCSCGPIFPDKKELSTQVPALFEALIVDAGLGAERILDECLSALEIRPRAERGGEFSEAERVDNALNTVSRLLLDDHFKQLRSLVNPLSDYLADHYIALSSAMRSNFLARLRDGYSSSRAQGDFRDLVSATNLLINLDIDSTKTIVTALSGKECTEASICELQLAFLELTSCK